MSSEKTFQNKDSIFNHHHHHRYHHRYHHHQDILTALIFENLFGTWKVLLTASRTDKCKSLLDGQH